MKPRLDPRVFLALTLSRTAQERLATCQKELKKYLANWHFIDHHNFHVTLRFLGEVPEAEIPEVDKICNEIAPRCMPFSLNWREVDFFGTVNNARVLFVSATDCPALNELASLSAERFRSIRDDRKTFRPHVTLAKARKHMEPHLQRMNANMLTRLREHGRIGPEEVDVSMTTVHREFVLLETVWVGRAVEYQIRERYQLGSGEEVSAGS